MSTKRKIGLLVLLAVLLGLVICLVFFIHHRMRYAVTNAVFVETDQLVFLGFQKVSGRLMEVTKEEGAWVKKGEVLARLDERPWQERLREIKGRFQAAKARVEAL